MGGAGNARHQRRSLRPPQAMIHHVESNIDDERDKIVRDLTVAGCVDAVFIAPRPASPRYFQNATGDDLRTDGNVSVVKLKDCETPLRRIHRRRPAITTAVEIRALLPHAGALVPRRCAARKHYLRHVRSHPHEHPRLTAAIAPAQPKPKSTRACAAGSCGAHPSPDRLRETVSD